MQIKHCASRAMLAPEWPSGEGSIAPQDLFSPSPFKERWHRWGLALSAGAESRSPLSEHSIRPGGGHTFCGRVWPRRRCGHRSGFKALVCVCVFWRGNGQDPSDLNKVLREFQSHLPLNSEKLDKSTMEERKRTERLRDVLGVVV